MILRPAVGATSLFGAFSRWRKVTALTVIVAWLAAIVVCVPARAESSAQSSIYQSSGDADHDDDLCCQVLHQAFPGHARTLARPAHFVGAWGAIPAYAPVALPPLLTAVSAAIAVNILPSDADPPLRSTGRFNASWPHAPPR